MMTKRSQATGSFIVFLVTWSFLLLTIESQAGLDSG